MKWLFFFFSSSSVHMHIVLRLYLDWWIDLSHISLARSSFVRFVSFVRATVAQRTEMLFAISEDRHRNEKNNCQGEPGAAEGTGGLASGEGVGCCHEMRCYGYSMSAFWTFQKWPQ